MHTIVSSYFSRNVFLNYCYTVVKRNQDLGKSYKRKYLIGGLVTVLKGLLMIIMWEAVSHDAITVSEDFISLSAGSR